MLNAALDAAQKQAILDRVAQIPAFKGLGFQIHQLEYGYCEATMAHHKELDGIFGSFHGGLLATAADTIACFAIMTQTGSEEKMATTDMNIRFLAPCFTDVTIQARVIKVGKLMCPVQVDLRDASQKLVAVAQVNYVRLT